MCGICLAEELQLVKPLPTCLPELLRALLDEWYSIPEDHIDNLILSMPRRCLNPVSTEYHQKEKLMPIKSVRALFPHSLEITVSVQTSSSPLDGSSNLRGGAAVAEWYRYRAVACLLTSSSPVPLKSRRVGKRCKLNLSRAETSSRWCGVAIRRGGGSSGVVHVT
ncbi:uncharacterized protein TNCV_819121 [Trichonephila clavipes]|nr:uncharacterized protein TNCV_819121 [Trichonephila clavipes]